MFSLNDYYFKLENDSGSDLEIEEGATKLNYYPVTVAEISATVDGKEDA